MKTLHVISRLETGGAQKLLSELLPSLAKEGVTADVLVFCRQHNHLEKHLAGAGIKIFSLDNPNIKSPALIPAIRKFIRNYDLVHVHLFPALYECAIASIATGATMVYTEHSTSNRRREKPFFQPIEKFIYSRYNAIIAISRQVADSLKNWVGDSIAKKIATIENGIDIQKIINASPYQEWNNRKVLLMVSRFNDSKDQNTVIRAIPLFKDPNLVVAFAGDGPNLNDSKKLTEELGVSDRVLFLGNRSDVPSLAKSCFIGVQSSNWEGFGLTAVEIMAARKPVIASDVNGLRQVVEGAGLIFKKGNPADLAECVNKLCLDKDFYASTAAACANRAKNYSINNTAKRYAELYARQLK